MSFGTAYATKKRAGKGPKMEDCYAEGGVVDDDVKDADMIARIMHKRKEYSQGGMVANDTGTGQEADKLPNQFDDLVLRDDLEDDHEEDKNIGDPEQDDRDADVVSKIMKSRKK